MEYRGKKDNKNYTMIVRGNKVESILVESRTTCHRTFYKRNPVMHEAAMTKEVFEEAILAICQDNIQQWCHVYYMLGMDKEYGQALIQEIFARHLN